MWQTTNSVKMKKSKNHVPSCSVFGSIVRYIGGVGGRNLGSEGEIWGLGG